MYVWLHVSTLGSIPLPPCWDHRRSVALCSHAGDQRFSVHALEPSSGFSKPRWQTKPDGGLSTCATTLPERCCSASGASSHLTPSRLNHMPTTKPAFGTTICLCSGPIDVCRHFYHIELFVTSKHVIIKNIRANALIDFRHLQKLGLWIFEFNELFRRYAKSCQLIGQRDGAKVGICIRHGSLFICGRIAYVRGNDNWHVCWIVDSNPPDL